MFKLMTIIDISDGKPGMMVPVFSSLYTNMPYVQQMDEVMNVKELVPFLSYENYPLVSPDQEFSVSIGDNGIIAFRSYDGAIFCGVVSEVIDFVSKNTDAISECALLHFQLQRITASDLKDSFDIWREVSRRVFSGDAQRRAWVDSEMRLHQKQRRIWDDIDPVDAEPPTSDESGVYGEIGQHSSEYLVRWLSNRRNFSRSDWTKVWYYVNELLPFDQRVTFIGREWLYRLDIDDNQGDGIRSILYALLERAHFCYEMHGEDEGVEGFADYILEKLENHDNLIVSLSKPKRFFYRMISFICLKASPGPVLRILALYAKIFNDDADVLLALKDGIDLMTSSEGGRISVAAGNVRDQMLSDVEIGVATELRRSVLYYLRSLGVSSPIR